MHEKTVSFLSPGALIRLAQDAAGGGADEGGGGGIGGEGKATSPRHSSRRERKHHPVVSAPASPAGAQLDGAVVLPNRTRSPLASALAAASAGTSPLLSVLEGGEALLKSGASAEEVRKEYGRLAVTLAMGRVRARILREGLCGVARNSSSCVGAWCIARGKAKEWGISGKATPGAESDGVAAPTAQPQAAPRSKSSKLTARHRAQGGPQG